MPKSQSENYLEKLLKSNQIQYIRSGYPDYAVLDSDGDICGFIEVKRNNEDTPTETQQIFRRFCIKNNITHTIWRPGDKLPAWMESLAGDGVLVSEIRMLDMRTASELLVREWLIKEQREEYCVYLFDTSPEFDELKALGYTWCTNDSAHHAIDYKIELESHGNSVIIHSNAYDSWGNIVDGYGLYVDKKEETIMHKPICICNLEFTEECHINTILDGYHAVMPPFIVHKWEYTGYCIFHPEATNKTMSDNHYCDKYFNTPEDHKAYCHYVSTDSIEKACEEFNIWLEQRYGTLSEEFLTESVAPEVFQLVEV